MVGEAIGVITLPKHPDYGRFEPVGISGELTHSSYTLMLRLSPEVQLVEE